ncbi:hypothetical protein [Streptomyces atratus]|uniref:hypothetical protein n=1 Tax=Streptomyces atratus TaxID=1893 RepID=UPI00379F3FF1
MWPQTTVRTSASSPLKTSFQRSRRESTRTTNRGEPATDWDTCREPWTAALQYCGGYDPQTAEQTLHAVLPDVLRFDRTKPAAYLNGRTLTDDVTSARLAMLTNGKVSSDHIGPHSDLLPEIPYLGAPHPAPPAGQVRAEAEAGIRRPDDDVYMDILGGTFKFRAWRGSDREHR